MEFIQKGLRAELIERAATLMREGSTPDIRLRAMDLIARVMGWYVKRQEIKLVTEFSTPDQGAVGYRPGRVNLQIVGDDDE